MINILTWLNTLFSLQIRDADRPFTSSCLPSCVNTCVKIYDVLSDFFLLIVRSHTDLLREGRAMLGVHVDVAAFLGQLSTSSCDS